MIPILPMYKVIIMKNYISHNDILWIKYDDVIVAMATTCNLIVS